jgi:hypothetical protein
MAKLRIRDHGPKPEDVRKRVEALKTPASKAIIGTFRDAAKIIQDQGRQEIQNAGLSARWVKGFTVKVTVPNGQELSPVLTGHHRIGYANVFERGATIVGRPLLWIPLPSAPKLGKRRLTPKLYFQSIGPLHMIRRPGRAPLLAGDALRAPAPGRPVSAGALRTGARNAKPRPEGARRARKTVSVPIFVGVQVAHVAKRLNVSEVYSEVRRQLPDLYRKNLAEQMKG